MTQSKIVLDADHGRVDSAADKTTQKYKQMGTAASDVGKAMGKWQTQLTGNLLKLAGITQAIRAVGSEISAHQSRTAEANKSTGGGALKREQALAALGLGGSTGEAFRGARGGASLSDRDDFLEQLAGAERSERVPYAQQEKQRALALFTSGVFSGEELIGGLKKRQGMGDMFNEQQRRLGALSPEAQQELSIRDFERQRELRAEAASAPAGFANRAAMAEGAARKAEQPIAAGVQGAFKSTLSAVGGDSLIEAGDTALIKLQQAMLGELQQLNARMPAPTLNTSPAGE